MDTDEDRARWVWRSLGDALHNLALPPAAQVDLIPALGHVDELALAFDCFFGAASHARERGWVSTDLDMCMKRIDKLLDWLSDDASQWDEEALAASNVWSTVRDLARQCLDQMPTEPWSAA